MAMSGPVLGALIDVAGNVAQPAAAPLSLPNWLLVATGIVTHIQTAGIVLPGSMACLPVGGPCTGSGAIGGMSAPVMGALCALGSAPLGAVLSVPVWTAIAGAIISELTTNATVPGATYSAPPPVTPAPATAGGPLTGASTIAGLSASRLGTAMNNAAGTAKSPMALATWQAVATQIVAHIQTLAVTTPTGLLAPAGGGTITGAATVT